MIGPASTTPNPPPIPSIAESSAIPCGTRWGGNSSRMIPNASGKIAPAVPWITRPASMTVIEVATAESTTPAKRKARATTSMRFLPNMSPSRPTTGVATDALRRYPVRIQAAPLVVVCRSSWIVRSAGTTRDWRSEYAKAATASSANVAL